MMRLSGQKVKQNTLLLAAICDRLSILAWQNTEAGQKGRNMPESIVEKLTSEKDKKPKYKTFASGEEFDAAFAKLQEEISKNG